MDDNHCDQIWLNYALWQNVKSFWQYFEGLFSKWQRFESSLENIFATGQIVIFANGQILNKQPSYLVTLIISQI